MGNSIEVTDTLCGPGARGVPRKSAVPEIAQLYALGLYRAWFRAQHPIGEVLSEWDLVGNNSVTTGLTGPDIALKFIRSDFRNYYAKTDVNRMRVKAGVPASGLREGRSLRADGLGIAVDPITRTIITELIEVTTVDEAQATVIEDLQPKLALLRGPIKTFVEAELRQRLSLESSALPDKFSANGTAFVVPPALCAVPILGDYGASTAEPAQYKWICFAPTFKYRPFPFPGIATVEPELSPTRGLILYSYHEFNSRVAVPKEVVSRFRAWTERQRRQYQRLELLPVPAVTQYWRDNNDDLKTLLAYAAVATFAVAAVVLAVYLAPVVAEVAAAALARMAAVATVETIAANAPQIVALVSSSMVPIMNYARGALEAASSLRPGQVF